MEVPVRIGIRGRLFLAFGAVAAMTVAASIIGWVFYTRLGDSLNQVVETNIPAMTLVTELAEEGSAIIGMAPALAAAPNESERDRIWKELSRNLTLMSKFNEELDNDVRDTASHESLKDLVAALSSNLRDLDENVRRKLWYSSQKEELMERLRWVSADFLDEVEPMLDDIKFIIDITLEQNASNTGSIRIGRSEIILKRASDNQQALLRINADGNLLIGLIGRAANLADFDSLRATELYLREVQTRVTDNLKNIKEMPGIISLRQAIEDILSFSEGEKSLFGLRHDELETQKNGSVLLERNREQVHNLGSLIAARVQLARSIAKAATNKSQQSIRQGKALMLATVGASLLFAVLIVWLYVGRNMVGRIIRLNSSMHSIADGDLKANVPVEGRDEIGAMAVSLRTFRDKLADTQAELVQAGKLAALGQLSAGVAHELNQPLAALRSYAHNSRRLIEMNQGPEAIQTLEKISRLTERMGGTINHLRTLARRSSSDLEPVDVKAVCEDAMSLLDIRFRDEDISITRTFPGHDIFIQAEAIRLEQVLINLFGNAIDAMTGRSRREFGIEIIENTKRVEMLITDTGSGIADDNLEHVFDPFFTTKQVGEGLGLGLSISYNIIKDFKGSMRVKSKEDTGTTFTIVLDKVPGSDL